MGVFKDLNYIKKIFRHPCATAGPTALILTGFAAASLAAGELITLGCLDIMAAKLGKPHLHHRGLKGLLKVTPNPTKINAFTSHASFGIGVARRALWYPWIAGVGTSFVANWVAMMYQEGNCTQPGAGYLTFPLDSLFIGPGAPGTVLIGGLGGRPCVLVGGNKIQVPIGCDVTISYSCNWQPFLGLPANQGPVRTWIEDNDGKHYGVSNTGTNDQGLSSATGGGFQGQSKILTGGREYEIKFEVESGLMGCVSGSVEISAYGRKIPLIPAGCVPKKVDWPFPTT